MKTCFERKRESYELIKDIRSMILFSRHDLTNNPPFLKLDLISCRNLLIYFGAKLQKQIIPLFHYSLDQGGILFLGKSETVGQYGDLFTTVDGKNKLFKRKPAGNIHPVKFSSFREKTQHEKEVRAEKKQPWTIPERIKETLYNTYEHPYVIIDSDHSVRQTSGDIRLFMTLPSGALNANLLKMVNSELQVEVRTVVMRAIRERMVVTGAIKRFELYENQYFVRVIAKPLIFTEQGDELFIVIFENLDIEPFLRRGGKSDQTTAETGAGSARVEELEHELATTKEHLQTYIEEIETSNEELQSLNEELQSTNEELQSSNEELETTNEELQSANEEVRVAYSELKTVNAALEEKELEILHQSRNQQALLNNTLQAFFLIDSSYQVEAFNKVAEDVVHKLSGKQLSKGVSAIELTLTKNLEVFVEELRRVFKGEEVVGERKETDAKGNAVWYSYNLTPVKDVNGKVNVVSLGLIDITEAKTFSLKLNSTERLLHSVFDASSNGICITDEKGIFVDVNQEYCRIYGYERDELIGRNFTMVVPSEYRAELQKLHDAFIAGEVELDAEWNVERKDASVIEVYASARLLEYEDGSHYKVTSVRDLTENKRYRNFLSDARETTGIGGWEYDAVTGRMNWSDEVFSIFKASEDSNAGFGIEYFLRFFEEEAQLALSAALDKAMKHGTAFDLELEAVDSANKLRWVRITSKPVRINKKTVKLFGTIQDVTKERRTEEELSSSRKQLSLIFDNLSDMVFNVAVDEEETYPILNVNDSFCELTGKTKEQLVGRPVSDVIPESTYEYAIHNYREAVKNGRKVKWEETVPSEDGTKTGIVSLTPVMNEEGRCYQLIGSISDITERKQAEDALKNIMDQSLDMICTIDSQGCFSNVSLAVESLLGFRPEEVQGRKFIDFVFEEDRAKTVAAAEDIMNGKPVTNFENRYYRKDGSAIEIIWSARWDEEDQLLYCIAKDATELKKAERIVHQERERYEAIFLQFPAYVVVLGGPDHVFQLVNPGFEELIGKTGITGKRVVDVLPEMQGQEVLRLLDQVYAGGKRIEAFEVPVEFRKDGGATSERVYLNFAFIPKKDEQNRVTGLYTFGIDVTREVESRRLIEESIERYEYVTKATSEAIWDYNLESDELYWGEGFQRLFNISFNNPKIQYKDWRSRVHADDVNEVEQTFLSYVEDEKRTELYQEYRFRRADDTYAFVEDRSVIIRDENGKALRAIGAIKDITQRKEEEQHLKLLESVVTNAGDAVLITEADPLDSPEGPRIVYVNEAFCRMSGYTPDEVIGKTPRLFQGPNSDVEQLHELGKALRKGKPFEIETINYTKNGQEFWNSFIVTPVSDESGRPVHFVSLQRDVTERKNRELQQRLATDISRLFGRPEQLRDVLDGVLECIAEFGDFTFAELWLPGMDKKQFQLTSFFVRDAKLRKKFSQKRLKLSVDNNEQLPDWLRINGDASFIADKSEDFPAEVKDIAKASGSHSIYAFPLGHNGDVSGVLIFADSKQAPKQRYFIPLFKDVCSLLADEINRKKLEEELNRIFISAPDIICVSGTDGYFKKINPAMSQLLGYSQDELLAQPIHTFAHPDDKEKTRKEVEDLKAGKGKPYFENRYITKSGNVVWLAWTTNTYAEEGLIYSVAKNVTEQKELEELLEEVNKLARIGGWEDDVKKGYTYWSEMACEILEAEPGFVPGHGEVLSRCVGESKARLKQAGDDAVKNGTSYDLELLVRTYKGNKKWIRSIGKAEVVDGKTMRLFGSIQDIHDRKTAEISLQQAYEEKNTILESIGDAFFAVDESWNVTYWNGMAELLLGLKKEQVLDHDIRTFFKEDLDEDFYDFLNKAAGQKQKIHFEHFSGVLQKWIEASVFPSDSGLTVYLRDISGRKEVEEELRRSNERFEKVTEATNDAIWDWDIRNDEMYRSSGFEQLFGCDYGRKMEPAEFWKHLFHPDDIDQLLQSVNEALSDPSKTLWQMEFRVIDHSNNIKNVIDRGVIIRDEMGKAVRMVGALTDITHRKEYEESLRSLNEKLEKRARELSVSNSELEQFAYVASHDLQEPLRMISSFMAQLEKKYGDQLDEKAQQYIYYAVDGAKRMRRIILDLLEYSRVGKHEDEYDTIDMDALIGEVLLLQRKRIQECGAVIKRGKMPEIKSYKSPLIQVFQNLLANAMKYSREGVKPHIHISCKQRKTEWQFKISDNGIGIDQEYFEKIFIIFQRLHHRDEYSGTGMGLAIVKKIIETLGGKIWVESEKDKGSTFYFTLPRN